VVVKKSVQNRSKPAHFWSISFNFLSISVKKVQKTLIFTLIFSPKTSKSYKITIFITTNHPIFQKNLQKTLFPSIFRLFYSSFLLFFFCLFRLMLPPAASAAQSPSATPPAIGATTAATRWAAHNSSLATRGS